MRILKHENKTKRLPAESRLEACSNGQRQEMIRRNSHSGELACGVASIACTWPRVIRCVWAACVRSTNSDWRWLLDKRLRQRYVKIHNFRLYLSSIGYNFACARTTTVGVCLSRPKTLFDIAR